MVIGDSLNQYPFLATRGQCKLTFTGQHVSCSQGLMESNTSTNHSDDILVRLAHHLQGKKFIFQCSLFKRPFLTTSITQRNKVMGLVLTLAAPTSNFSSGEYRTAVSGLLVRMKQMPCKYKEDWNMGIFSAPFFSEHFLLETSWIRLSSDLCISWQFHSSLSRHCITGVKHSACWDSTEHGQVFQSHLRGPILT